MSLSSDIALKSLHAAIAAIEIYNKPNFSYREEAFALLMTNAWELLLKAKWLLDHEDRIAMLYDTIQDDCGNKIPKLKRSGSALTYGLVYPATKLLEDKNSGFERQAYSNILGLVEIRDNAAHFISKDIYFGRRVLEIGTASLRNYVGLAIEWFQLDLSAYNFFLMPISFYHGFETVEPISKEHYPEHIQSLLRYLDALEQEDIEGDARQYVTLRLQTKIR